MAGEAEIFLLREPDLVGLARARAHWLPALRKLAPKAEVIEVGSTALPGLIGKQDLDVLVRVAAEDFTATRSLFDGVFPRDPNQVSDEELQAYRPDASATALAIQLTVAGGPYDCFTEFLEILRRDEALRDAYTQLKRRFSGAPMQNYREAKSAFIESVLNTHR